MRWLLLLPLLLAPLPAAASAPVQEVTAANGLKAWLIEDHALPVVTVKIEYGESGSVYDPPQKEGLAHFTSQMLDEGSGDMDSLTFHRALEDSAIRFSAEANEDDFAATVQTLSQYKDHALSLFTLALTHPRFDADAVERVRGGLISQLKQMQESPVYTSSLRWKQAAFGTSPYARPRHGTLDSLGRITSEDLKEYAATSLACAPRRIAVVGDISAREVKHWLETSGLGMARECKPREQLSQVTMPEGGAPILVQMPVAQTAVMASMPGVSRQDPRYYTVEVLNYILGGDSLSARLGREIRDKRGLAYFAESELEDYDHVAFIAVHFSTRNAQTEKAIQVFQDEMKKIATGDVTQEELTNAKNYLTGSFPLQLDTQSALADYLIGMQHYNLGIDYLQKRNAKIEAVTLDEVNQAARMLFAHPPLIVMAGAPAADGKSK